MKLKENALYSVLSPTSMGVRFTPTDHQPIHMSSTFALQATSAETNVLTPIASLGQRVKILTRFVKDSPIANYIIQDLRRRNIEFDAAHVNQESPWGERHQINFADSGFGLRAPQVYNDRAGEVGRNFNIKGYDLNQIFSQDGVKILHLSGLVLSLSKESAAFCIALVEKAKAAGTCVSFDLNYRPSFWKNREEELRTVFQKIASFTDILIGNEEEFQLALGIEGPTTTQPLQSQMDHYQSMIRKVKKTYPQISIVATTLREVKDSSKHLWGSIIYDENEFHIIEPKPIDVFDRIGGGDGYVGGLLYSILKGWTIQQANQFGWAMGAYAVTVQTDYAMPYDEAQIWNIWNGNARVNR